LEPNGPVHLSFDDVAIDFAGRRLLRGGIEQPLEPKAFGVLALLASAPGQVFTRDQILDAVWGHRHITPNVLNRAITLLRHALGEDARGARYLHTVHAIGYRFDLPRPGPEYSTPSTPRLASETEPLATQAPMRRANDKRHAFPRMALWLPPLLLVLGLAGWKWWPRGDASQQVAPAVASATKTTTRIPTIVVVPLKPIGDSASTRTIADGLSEELIGDLARIGGLRVIAQESTRIAATDSTDPAMLAKRLGVTHVLEGSLQQDGQQLRFHLRLLDATNGHALWTRDFDREASEVLALQRQIAASVAESLTLKLGLATAASKSGDAEFLRRFLAAQALLNRFGAPGQTAEPAEAEFRALLRERPDDARVHAALAVALNFRATYYPGLPASVRDDALQEAATAQRLDPSLPEPYFIRAFVTCQRDEWEPCVSLIREAAVRGMKVVPLASPAVILARMGYLDRAEALAREIVARDPLNPNAHFTLGRVLDTLGRHDEAKAEFVASLHSSDVQHYGYWFNAFWRKDYATTRKLVDEGLAPNDPRSTQLMPGYVATMRALTGKGSWAQADAENRKFEQDTGLFALLRVIEPDAPAHVPELIAGLESMRKGGYSTWDLVLWNKEYAFLRRDPAFQDYLRRSGILAYWKQHGFPKQCRPQGDGAYCE
jgi:TolB-like protein/DNA-binding winged helix-turn-helix (wHTH) protein